MKKMIMLAAVIVTAGLSAQAQKAKVSERVTERFNQEFSQASEITWTKVGGLFLSRFYDNQDYCLAYFDADGKMLLSGKQISFDHAPTAVKKATQRIRNASEKTDDLLRVAGIYELTGDEGTSYFINLDSESLNMSLIAYGDGSSKVLSKTKINKVRNANPVMITKQ